VSSEQSAVTPPDSVEPLLLELHIQMGEKECPDQETFPLVNRFQGMTASGRKWRGLSIDLEKTLMSAFG